MFLTKKSLNYLFFLTIKTITSNLVTERIFLKTKLLRQT